MVPWLCPGRRLGQGQVCAAAYMTYHVRWWGESDWPAGPGHVTTDMISLDTTKRSRDLVKRGSGALHLRELPGHRASER